MNERTHFFIKIYLSHFILQKVDVVCGWCCLFGDGNRLLYWPSSTSFSSWLGCSTVGHWGPKALCCPGSQFGILSPTNSNRPAPGYIIFSRPPASAVLPLIYTGASLDWQLGRGSIYNRETKKIKIVVSLFGIGKLEKTWKIAVWFLPTFLDYPPCGSGFEYAKCITDRRKKCTRLPEFKSWRRMFVFLIALIPLAKVWIQLFFLPLWVNSKADWTLKF